MNGNAARVTRNRPRGRQRDRDQDHPDDPWRKDGPARREVRADASGGIERGAERQAGQPAEDDRTCCRTRIDRVGIPAERRHDHTDADDRDADRLDGCEGLAGDHGEDRRDRALRCRQRPDHPDLARTQRDVFRPEPHDVAQPGDEQVGDLRRGRACVADGQRCDRDRQGEPEQHDATERRPGTDHPRRARRRQQRGGEARGRQQAADERGQGERLMKARAYGPEADSSGLG